MLVHLNIRPQAGLLRISTIFAVFGAAYKIQELTAAPAQTFHNRALLGLVEFCLSASHKVVILSALPYPTLNPT
jgi:hypothetical protein